MVLKLYLIVPELRVKIRCNNHADLETRIIPISVGNLSKLHVKIKSETMWRENVIHHVEEDGNNKCSDDKHNKDVGIVEQLAISCGS